MKIDLTELIAILGEDTLMLRDSINKFIQTFEQSLDRFKIDKDSSKFNHTITPSLHYINIDVLTELILEFKSNKINLDEYINKLEKEWGLVKANLTNPQFYNN